MSRKYLKRGVVDNSVAPGIAVRRGCVSERLSGARENIPAAWPCTDCTSDILGDFRSYPLELGAMFSPKSTSRNDLDSIPGVFLTS